MVVKDYNEFISEKINLKSIKKIVPFLMLSYMPSSEVSTVPNVLNNSKYTIRLKPENSSKVVTLLPGESYHKRIDGVYHPKLGVYKVVDFVDEIFGIKIEDTKITTGNLPTYINDKLGGGYLKNPPDEGWDRLFHK